MLSPICDYTSQSSQFYTQSQLNSQLVEGMTVNPIEESFRLFIDHDVNAAIFVNISGDLYVPLYSSFEDFRNPWTYEVAHLQPEPRYRHHRPLPRKILQG